MGVFLTISGISGLSVVVLVGFLRAIFSKPKLEFKFSVAKDSKGNQVLVCELTNTPRRNWVMRVLFVPRPRIDDISVVCEIMDRSDKLSRVGTLFLADMVTIDKRKSKQLSLPASVFPVTFSVIAYSKEFGVAAAKNTRAGDVSLAEGVAYVIKVTALVGDKKIKSYSSGFVIKGGITLLPQLSSHLLMQTERI